MSDQPVNADDYYAGDDIEGADEAPWPEEFKPLYDQLLQLMQQGMWRDASEMLAAMEDRYPGEGRLDEARRLLGLRLSAEQSWNGTKRRRTPAGRRLIRALLIANVLLYSLLLAFYLLGKGAGF